MDIQDIQNIKITIKSIPKKGEKGYYKFIIKKKLKRLKTSWKNQKFFVTKI